MTLSRLTLALLFASLPWAPAALYAAPASVSQSASQTEEKWTINLKDASIRDFIDQVSEISGETFIVDPRVKGQVTVVSKKPITLSEVYQLFLSVMATHGYTVLSQDGYARV